MCRCLQVLGKETSKNLGMVTWHMCVLLWCLIACPGKGNWKWDGDMCPILRKGYPLWIYEYLSNIILLEKYLKPILINLRLPKSWILSMWKETQISDLMVRRHHIIRYFGGCLRCVKIHNLINNCHCIQLRMQWHFI